MPRERLHTRRIDLLVAVALLVAGTIVGCAPDRDDPSGGTEAAPTPTASADCSPSALNTIAPDRLTWAASRPVTPWVEGDPNVGAGYEAATAAEVSARLGFSGRTTWITVPENEILSTAPKDFDVGLGQIIITPERGTAVDFSTSYYDVPQAVVALAGSPAVDVASLNALADVRIGAQEDTQAETTLEQVVSSQDVVVIASANATKGALIDGTVDAIVVDLPTAYYLTTVELPDARIVGTLPRVVAEPAQFGMVLQSGSPLTVCVARVIDEMRRDGTLSALEHRWVSTPDMAPLLD